ncbi:MAG: hypothetical protein KBG85_15515 [Micropruina sp.]|nr:hypothetical protein [Micropruina sp.]
MRRFGCLIALTLLSACSMVPGGSPSPGPSEASPSGSPSRFITTQPLPSASVPAGTPAEVSAARLEAIRADLTGRGVQAGEVRVVSADNVRFNDGSLGCPRPGVQYTQAQVDGMRVVVEAGGRSFDYRFGRGDAPVLCEQAPGASRSNR